MLDISTLPSTVTKLGKNIFELCHSIKEFTIPPKVSVIPEGMFRSGFNATDNQILDKVILHDKVKGIEACAFFNCKKLKEINLHDNITNIGDEAFSQCENVSVYIPKNIKKLGKKVFFNCFADKELTISGVLKAVPVGMISDNKHIEKIMIEDGIKKINGQAFSNCPNLKEIYLPATLEKAQGKKIFNNSIHVTAYGIPGTLAETLATENGVPFKNINE